MLVNAVAPFEGELCWKGKPVSGTSQSGKSWFSIDFSLKYKDSQMNEKVITFSAFGEDKVSFIENLPDGVTLRVFWWPESVFARTSGKYFPKLSVISIGIVQQSGSTAPASPAAAPAQPAHIDMGPGPGDDDLPF